MDGYFNKIVTTYNKVELNFVINYKKLLNFDIIRKLRFIEIFQYSTLGIILVLYIGKFSEKYIFSNSLDYLIKMNIIEFNDFNNKNKYYFKKKDIYSKLLFFVISSFEAFFFIILLFYLKKILKLIPSISNLYNSKFIPFLTFETSLTVAFGLILIRKIPSFENKISLLSKII
tara:strand:- start:868 stop:1386 length:519 start_codon:yes stop_codon:yes gene_type:complete